MLNSRNGACAPKSTDLYPCAQLDESRLAGLAELDQHGYIEMAHQPAAEGTISLKMVPHPVPDAHPAGTNRDEYDE